MKNRITRRRATPHWTRPGKTLICPPVSWHIGSYRVTPLTFLGFYRNRAAICSAFLRPDPISLSCACPCWQRQDPHILHSSWSNLVLSLDTVGLGSMHGVDIRRRTRLHHNSLVWGTTELALLHIHTYAYTHNGAHEKEPAKSLPILKVYLEDGFVEVFHQGVQIKKWRSVLNLGCSNDFKLAWRELWPLL
jgi:hypothetical protein